MSEENTSGSKTPKILGAVIAIAAVVGIVGWFANRGTADATTITTTNTGKLETTGTDPKNEVTTTTTTSTKTTDGTATDTTTITTPATGTTTTVTSSSTYKDGTYSATGSYTSPAGGETVDISLTIKDDKIVAATFKGNATNPGSKMWQGKFSEGYSSVVVGKSISELALTVVNGSSLTPKGFMDAVADIKAEAQS